VKSGAAALDTTAKDDQLQILIEHHVGVEDRLERAYQNAKSAASTLMKAVKEYSQYSMPIRFVSEREAAEGILSTTFSFNLPSLPGVSPEVNEELAQHFVDTLCAHKRNFKPCVSFGQDNTLVYATVPATSTQGAIKAEDKQKQAVGGVQLVRLSFPPTGDMDEVCEILRSAVEKMYSQ